MRVHIIRAAFACGATMFQARAWYVNMQGILTLARALMKVMMPGDVSHWGEIETSTDRHLDCSHVYR